MLSRRILFSLFLLFGLYNSIIIGISYDEFFHIENAQERIKYLFSLGFYNYYGILHLKYYPGLYDTLSSLIVSFFPRYFFYESYHIVNFIIGFLGLIGLKKFVKILFNKNTSDIFFVLCFFSPIYFGHLGINPKDTIIATANFWILYYIFKYFSLRTTKQRTSTAIKIGLFIGLGAGVRIMFLGTLIPLIAISLFEIFYLKKISKKVNLKLFFFDILRIIIISYLLIIICWPDVHSNILLKPFSLFIESLNDSTQGVQFSYFAGFFYETNNTPWYYLLLNLFFKLPVFYLLLFFISILISFSINNFYLKENKNFLYFFIISIILFFFPIIISILLKLKIHDGIRYFLYIVPLFNILPSLLLSYLYFNRELLINKFIIIFISPFLIYFIISFTLITPYQYSYLNIFNKYFMKDNSFENDYWGTSIKELVKKFTKIKSLKSNPKIAVCGANADVVEYYLKKYGLKNFIKTDLNKKFDYAFLINRAISYNDTCFEKFQNNENLLILSKNSVVLSKVIKY